MRTDWAMATGAAPWVELAVLGQWLIGGDHTPEQAERWLGRCPSWGEAGRDVLDDCACREVPDDRCASSDGDAPGARYGRKSITRF